MADSLRTRICAVLVTIATALAVVPAFGAGPGVIEAFDFETPEQEARYRALTEEFRCPKCLNTNLAGSDSPIAADLRSAIHRLILEGESDRQIREYLHDRYGDFVLYDPPVRADTVLLWILPVVLLAVGVLVVVVMVRRRAGDERLDDDERARLDALLADADPANDRK
jgi:cytochrome c-type biogenesis protein CcmH